MSLTSLPLSPHWRRPTRQDSSDGWSHGLVRSPPLQLAYYVADLDGDRADEVIVAQRYINGDDIFSWYRLESGTWVERNIGVDTLSDQPRFVGDMTTADMDGDLDLDVVIPNESSPNVQIRAWWFENPGTLDGSWTGHPIDLAPDTHKHAGDIEVSDMDNDGKPDIVVRDLGENDLDEPGFVHIAFQDSLPQGFTVRTFEVRRREGLKLADLDRDGDDDIVLSTAEGQLGWLRWYQAPAAIYTSMKTNST